MKAALHVKDEERSLSESRKGKKNSFIFALQRFFPLLGGVIRVVICTNHLLSDTLPSLAQSQYCIDGPPKSITSSLQTNKGSNQHANLLGKAWHAKKQFTTFFICVTMDALCLISNTVIHILFSFRELSKQSSLYFVLKCFSIDRNTVQELTIREIFLYP